MPETGWGGLDLHLWSPFPALSLTQGHDKDDIQNVSQSRMDTRNWSRTLEGLAGSYVTHSLLDPEKSQGFREELGLRS